MRRRVEFVRVRSMHGLGSTEEESSTMPRHLGRVHHVLSFIETRVALVGRFRVSVLYDKSLPQT